MPRAAVVARTSFVHMICWEATPEKERLIPLPDGPPTMASLKWKLLSESLSGIIQYALKVGAKGMPFWKCLVEPNLPAHEHLEA